MFVVCIFTFICKAFVVIYYGYILPMVNRTNIKPKIATDRFSCLRIGHGTIYEKERHNKQITKSK